MKTLYVYIYIWSNQLYLLNFTRSWGFGIFRYIGFQSQNASFRATCAQKGREEKCWMLWFLLNQWSTSPTGVPEKLKQSETVGNSRKQSETVGNSWKQSETVGSGPAWSCQNCPSAFFLQKKTFRAIPFCFWKCNGKQLETFGARTFDSAKKTIWNQFIKKMNLK